MQSRKKVKKSSYIIKQNLILYIYIKHKIQKVQNIEFQKGERMYISLRDKKNLHREMAFEVDLKEYFGRQLLKVRENGVSKDIICKSVEWLLENWFSRSIMGLKLER